MKSKRILHCIPSMGGGGAERQLAYLAGGLAASGWDVHVALFDGGPNMDRLRATGATVHELCPRGRSYPVGFLGLLRLMRRIRPDVVQTWLHQMDVLGGLAASLLGVPFVLSERSCGAAYPGHWRDRLRLAAGRRASAVIANSKAGEAYWVSRGFDPSRTGVMRNVVPFEEIANVSGNGIADLGMDPAYEWVIFAGRFSEEKNLGKLIGSLQRVFDARPQSRALFFGRGPLKDHLVAVRDRAGLSDRVRIKGYTDRLWTVMKRARVFVSPSRFEGQPNTVLEAVACRCPVVLSDIPAHRELFDEESAWLVPPTSTVALAGAIRQVLEDPGVAQRKAECALRKIAGHSLEETTKEYAAWMKRVMG